MRAAVKELEEYLKIQEEPAYVYAVILDYEGMLERTDRTKGRRNEAAEEKKKEQKEELRRFTNYIESIILYEHSEG